MKIIKKIAALKKEIRSLRQKHKRIGFVPTMGALHAGHVILIKRARRQNQVVVVSIFVNPAQFAPAEDFKKYPRDLKNDAAICRKAGVDIIFSPSAEEMYPAGFASYISVEGLSDVLCGVARPGHFRGVSTIVAKLINIVEPDTLYFGQKDAQQAVIIKRMTQDLNFPLCVKVIPTVREASGLALSSRNAYLSVKEKFDATFLYRSLCLARGLVKSGIKDTAIVIRRMKDLIKERPIKIDYISIVDLKTLTPLKKIRPGTLIALAARVGKTRLIDNIIL